MAYSSNRKLNFSLLTSPYFIASVLLFCINQVLQFGGIRISMLYSYLDDFLALPVVMTLTVFIQQNFFYNQLYRLTIYQVLFTVVYFYIIFEVVLPKYSSKYTADPLDGIAYLAGGLVYYFLIVKKQKSHS